jgi:hypothetical protein
MVVREWEVKVVLVNCFKQAISHHTSGRVTMSEQQLLPFCAGAGTREKQSLSEDNRIILCYGVIV